MPSLRELRHGPSFAPLALLGAAIILSAAVASAAPAIVTAGEADVHSAPFKSTPVLYTFHAGDKISADEQAHDGWRRVHTPDGRLGFVHDEEVRLGAAPVPEAKAPAPPFPTTPAKVKTFELPARSAPHEAAPILQRVAEGEALAVSQEETGDFRRVILADGRIAFVEAAGVTLVAPGTVDARAPGSSATAPVQPIGGPAARAPIIYVKDLDHLADLTKADGVVHPMVNDLATRETTGGVIATVGGGAGLLAMFLAATFLRSQSCTGDVCIRGPNVPLFIGGAVGLAAAATVGYVILPKRDDLLDVINAWNQRHTDNQFTIESHEIGSGH